MKILVIDVYGVGVDYCLRAQWAGHDVRHFLTPNSKYPDIGKGLTIRVQDWRKWMKWADLIVCTASAKYAADLEPYYEMGYPIFGANKGSAALELDRCVGMELLQAHGIETLPYTRFSKYEDALAHVRATNGSYACKPIGDADRSLSYVASGPDDMCTMMKRAQRLYGGAKQDFILQQKAVGVEFAVGGWFGPGGFNDVAEENFEHKPLYAGDTGPNTGEMGTAMKYCEIGQSKLFQQMLQPLAPALKALRFCGNIDVSVIIDEDGKPWPLEFTMRMGWPAFYLNQHLHKGDPVQWMKDLVDGTDSLKVSYDHCIGVCVVGPNFPHNSKISDECEGVPIYGINHENIANVHLCEVMAVEDEVFENEKWISKHLFATAGSWPLVIVGTGPSVVRAKDACYKVVKEVKIPNSHGYRPDIGDRCKRHIKTLQGLGYAKSWEYGDD
jgi:phosphoribosylamine---glycine ligase